MWWISYRGEASHGINNIGVFEDDGAPRRVHPLLLDPSPTAHPLHIARGFAIVGDDLYIANAWRKDSHVARYQRRGDTFHFADVVVASSHISAMVHPFDVELGDDGRLYISCQDTNTVVAILPETRAPAPIALHLRKQYPKGNFLPGTQVASAQGNLPEVGETVPLDVPAPQGLAVVLDKRGKPRHSVRGIIVHRKHLVRRRRGGRHGEDLRAALRPSRGAHQGEAREQTRASHPARGDALHWRVGFRQHPRVRHPQEGAQGEVQAAHRH